MNKELLGEALTRELKLIFNQDKVQKDFDNYVSAELTERVIQDGKTMVVCIADDGSDDGRTILFPEGVQVTVFSIVYQANIADDYDSSYVRVWLAIGSNSTEHGITSSEFGYALFHYNQSAEYYSMDVHFNVY